MMTKPAHLIGRSGGGLARRRNVWFAWLSLLLLLSVGPALAANTLKSVSASPLAGGKVQLTLTFSNSAVKPQAFSTRQPPRIAMDFVDTRNRLAQRSYSFDQGDAKSVAAVEADGRTRVVVNLRQPAPYVTRVAGNQVIVTIGAGATASATPAAAAAGTETAATATAVAAHRPALAPVAPPPPSQRAYAGVVSNPDQRSALADGNVITAIDFGRSKHGAGKLTIEFSKAGAAISKHASGDTTVIDVAGANLAASQARRLDVSSYATPVRSVNAHAIPGGAKIKVKTVGVVQTTAFQTGNTYVMEFARPQPGEHSALGAPKPVVYHGSRVTFNFQNIPVRSVLQLLAGISNLNIVASDSVRGNVTLRLNDVPWDQALAVILRAKGLGMRKNGNVIWIAPQSQIAKYEHDRAEAREKALNSAPLVTDYIPINYGNAAQIAKLLTSGSRSSSKSGTSSGFLSPRGSVTYDRRTNTLLVNDTPEKIREIRQLVSVLDRPVKQVLIEARLVIATDSFTHELGAQLSIGGFRINPSGQILTTSSDIGGVSTLENNVANAIFDASQSGNPQQVQIPAGLNVSLPAASPTGTIGFGILGNNYLLNLELSAAQQEGRTETISQPKVITANNQEASIQQGKQIGYVTASGVGVTPTVKFKTVALQLNVTPTITSDGRVFMKLQVLKDALDGEIQAPGGGFVPQISHREIDTSVLVGNGQTVVLGGVYEFTNSHDVSKVPFLGDIPILGALFRDKKNHHEKAELLVFITPHVLGQTTTVN